MRSASAALPILADICASKRASRSHGRWTEQRYEWGAPEDTLTDVEEQHAGAKEHQTFIQGQAGTH